MSNIRLFFSEALSLNMIGKLDKSQSHYLNKVMRIREKEVFSLFNSYGEWEAKILTTKKNIIEFQVTKQLRHKENLKEIWLAFSPIKSNYQNIMIQKATELGVTKFIPIIFERSIVRKVNKDRLKKILIEACEQSNRINIPTIEDPQTLKTFLKSGQYDLIFTDLNSNNKKIDVSKLTSKPICIIIGPEGDFSEIERKEIISYNGVISININKNILRAETAAISAVSLVSYLINL
tara:strand:+ start:537 stop:1241 length:705 start_codon:yes stop_codon:yes gene_type:complete